jgi:hypothetical protein
MDAHLGLGAVQWVGAQLQARAPDGPNAFAAARTCDAPLVSRAFDIAPTAVVRISRIWPCYFGAGCHTIVPHAALRNATASVAAFVGTARIVAASAMKWIAVRIAASTGAKLCSDRAAGTAALIAAQHAYAKAAELIGATGVTACAAVS